MGKYMRKSKKVGKVGLLEASHVQSSLGVRTRAKTLALQRLQKSNPAAAAAAESAAAATFTAGGDGGSYLQLRSRRLEKPSVVLEGKRQKQGLKDPNLPNPKPSPNSNPVQNQMSRTSSFNSGLVSKVQEEEEKELLGAEEKKGIHTQQNKNEISSGDAGVEASFGENLLEHEGRERTTRESTPCSLIKHPDSLQTPESSTKPTNASAADSRVPNSGRIRVPIAQEMDEFFTRVDEKHRRRFIEKYNFDPLTEKPLPGRFEWVKLGD